MQVEASAMNSQGRVVIPAAIRRAMGLTEPSELIFRFDGSRLYIETIESAVDDVQRMASAYRPSGGSAVDELIAERRAEAELE